MRGRGVMKFLGVLSKRPPKSSGVGIVGVSVENVEI